MTMPKAAAMPRGHLFRISRAKHTPEALTLQPCDVAALLGVGLSHVYRLDDRLRPARVGVRTRRYSWARYLAYRAAVGMGDGE